MTPFEHYFDTFNLQLGYDELITLRGEVAGQIQVLDEEEVEAPSVQKLRDRLSAQLAALDRQTDQHLSGDHALLEVPHPYSIDLETACKNLKTELGQRGSPDKSIAKVDAASARYRLFVSGNPGLSTIRRPRVMSFIRDARAKGLSRATVSNDLSYLGQAFQRAMDEGYLSENYQNPFKGHRLEGFRASIEPMRFTNEQLGKIMLSTRKDADLLAAILVGFYTGMRISEIFTARFAVAADTEVWDVAFDGGKTASAKRMIPVHPALKVVLTKLERWPQIGHSIPWETSTADALGKRFGRAKKTLLEAEGVPDQRGYNIHSLRHGFISLLNELGHNEFAIADLSGHSKGGSSTEAGRTYIRPRDIAARKAIIVSIPKLAVPKGVF